MTIWGSECQVGCGIDSMGTWGEAFSILRWSWEAKWEISYYWKEIWEELNYGWPRSWAGREKKARGCSLKSTSNLERTAIEGKRRIRALEKRVKSKRDARDS